MPEGHRRLVLLSPSLPLLFMGEEYGETAPFLYFTREIQFAGEFTLDIGPLTLALFQRQTGLERVSAPDTSGG